MKTQSFKVPVQLGIDKSIPAAPETAQVLSNWAYDPQTKAWHSNVGYEPYFKDNQYNGPFSPFGLFNKPVDSLYAFQRHNSAQQYILFECNGRLAYLDPKSSSKVVTLETNRTVPNPTRERTSYEPFGRYVIITNGIDNPLKFRGDDRTYPLGWSSLPNPPVLSSSPEVTAAGEKRTYEAADGFIQDSGNNSGQRDTAFTGVSSEDADETVRYYYKVSFINEAGSESPLSNESNLFTYSGASITRGSNSGVPKICARMEIPVGPPGTVARRIYRTKQSGDQSLFYQLETLKNNVATVYVDYRDDLQLGPEAPSVLDSIPFPAPSCKVSASFKNCLFLDGGEMDPTRLYYSAPLEPDRYRALDYLEVGTREGGDIVGLEAYYNSLLVFRENAVDLVRTSRNGNFELVPFVEGIGTWSNNSIVAIPNLGVAFLSRDGCYVITGGLDGGADLTMNKISKPMDEWFERFAIDSMPAAVGCYSQRDQELHFYVPQTGRSGLFHGLIFHINNGQWSTREGFPLSCVTVDKDSNILFGAKEYTQTPIAGSNLSRGIYAISRLKRSGVEYSLVDPNVQEGPRTLSEFQSQWIDLGAPEVKKYIKYVYVYAVTGGDQTATFQTYKDRDRTTAYEAGTYKWQQADNKDQGVYGTAKWDTAQWEDRRLASIRFPVAMGAVQDFSFVMTTEESIHFVGYDVEFVVDGAKGIKGKG